MDEEASKTLKEKLITVLEASWELNPTIMEDVMWEMIEDYFRLYSSESVCL